MKELSIFVDESGDFGKYSTHSETLLFQSNRNLKKDFLKGIRKKAFKD